MVEVFHGLPDLFPLCLSCFEDMLIDIRLKLIDVTLFCSSTSRCTPVSRTGQDDRPRGQEKSHNLYKAKQALYKKLTLVHAWQRPSANEAARAKFHVNTRLQTCYVFAPKMFSHKCPVTDSSQHSHLTPDSPQPARILRENLDRIH